MTRQRLNLGGDYKKIFSIMAETGIIDDVAGERRNSFYQFSRDFAVLGLEPTSSDEYKESKKRVMDYLGKLARVKVELDADRSWRSFEAGLVADVHPVKAITDLTKLLKERKQ